MSNQVKRLFLSHSHKDNSFVDQLACDIEDAGVQCWLDLWEMRVGDSLRRRVEEGIRAADWLAVVLSQNSVASKWVEEEISMGFVRELEERNVFILPLVLDDCNVPLSLRDKFFADFRHDYKVGLNTLVHRLQDLPPEQLTHLRRLHRRWRKCDDDLPIYIAYLSTTLEAGMSLRSGIAGIVNLLPGPLSEEFKKLIDDWDAKASEGLNGCVEEVFQNLVNRIPTYRIQLFVAAIKLASRTGGNISKLLQKEFMTQIKPGQLL